jgi:hypothetical protein
MATTAHRAHIPSAHKIYQGTGKTVDEAIKDAHKQIPRHRQGPAVNRQTNELTPAKNAAADVPIRCRVLDIHYESGGFTGASTFSVRVTED